MFIDIEVSCLLRVNSEISRLNHGTGTVSVAWIRAQGISSILSFSGKPGPLWNVMTKVLTPSRTGALRTTHGCLAGLVRYVETESRQLIVCPNCIAG
ncbi:hypothetical protein An17g00960 [Aspergillus niger]|uniref:Uncharacterized protein n=2 Tax=Aspergillus niger TaxID=5061 RepID=A2R9D3_ASPNC|nr:hypothetical protein An17g00960 [Aspergillus niger]CAK48798.1 hypothetical protein An17g00960 [Aspergillus niger]